MTIQPIGQDRSRTTLTESFSSKGKRAGIGAGRMVFRYTSILLAVSGSQGVRKITAKVN